MKIYEGSRCHNGISVTVDGKPLNPRFDLWFYDFDGFEWGYGGSGALQLALALLADHLNDERQAAALCKLFALSVIAKLPHAGWKLTDAQIDETLKTELLQSVK